MGQRLSKASIWRFGVFACSAGAILGLLYLSYCLYWRILHRHQTSEFALLADLLPTKLSIYLIKGDGRSLQQTIDRNGGRFGIVVTDCESTAIHCLDQQILYASQTQVKSASQTQLLPQTEAATAWLDRLGESPSEALSGEFFLPLRFPYPLDQDWPFQSRLIYPPVTSNQSQPGRIIGRVYLIRTPQPSFRTDLQDWLQAPTQSDRALFYSAVALTTLLTAGLTWVGLELAVRRMRQFQAEVAQIRSQAIAAKQAAAAEYTLLAARLDAAIAARDEAILETEERELTTAGFIEAAELAWQAQEAAEAAAEAARQRAQRLAAEIAIVQTEKADLEIRFDQMVMEQRQIADLENQLNQAIAAQAKAIQEKVAAEELAQKHQAQINYLYRSIGEDDRQLQARYQELEATYHRAEAEIQQLRAEIERLRAKSKLKIFIIRTATDALAAAAAQFSVLEVWQSAKSSARTASLRHYSAEKVYQNLKVLAEVGTAFFQDALTTDLDDIFKNKGVQYSPHESPRTMARYGEQRIFKQGNQTKQMVRHLKVGRRLRIYFDFEKEQQKVQIGYCGNHLPTIQD